ncbi:sugar transferase [Methyloligella sp. 2.7D]|uniref:sugar transferase n=1 Tax=Methyloligella sp. 2.7D TaxID=3085160 RepID=UPI002FDA27F5
MTDIDIHHVRSLRDEAAVRHRETLRIGLSFLVGILDLLIIFSAAVLASYLRAGVFISEYTRHFLLIIFPLYLVIALGRRAYSLKTLAKWSSAVRRAETALIMTALLVFAAAFSFKVSEDYSRLEIGYLFTIAAMLLALSRIPIANIVAGNELIQTRGICLADDVHCPIGREVAEVIGVTEAGLEIRQNDPRFWERLNDYLDGFDRVVLSFQDSELRNEWVAVLRQTGFPAEVVYPDISRLAPLGIGRWGEDPTLVVARGPLSVRDRVLKRLFDLSVTLLLLPLVLPVACLIAIAIRAESRGSVIFVQKRLGRHNHSFYCWKFRTMRAELTDMTGNRSASRDDDRITRVGKFLRQTSLDEVPQLWNVLMGDMSLVGPRPHALGSRAKGALFWDAAPNYWERHAVKPGMTGLAQVRGHRGATHTTRDLELRVASDLDYINTWSLWKDIQIIVRTCAVIVHRNAY